MDYPNGVGQSLSQSQMQLEQTIEKLANSLCSIHNQIKQPQLVTTLAYPLVVLKTQKDQKLSDFIL
jgi:hypothetical protein